MGPLGILKAMLLLVAGIPVTAAVFRFIWKTPSRARSIAMGAALSGFTLGFLFLALETLAANVLIQSDNLGFTRSSQRWMDVHWKPINALGFRDVDHDTTTMRDRRVVFVVGDSFAAGMGTDDYRDRFVNVLGDRLGPDWEVVVVAKNGWNTAQQVAALHAMPWRPDLLVLSYYVNDIEGAGIKEGHTRPPLVTAPSGALARLAAHSWLLDLLYWRVYRFRNAHDMSATYYAHLEQLYTDERVWQTHFAELDSVIDYASSHDARAVALLIPRLTDIESSRSHLARVDAHLRQRGVVTVPLANRIGGRDARTLVANPFDAHPSRQLHAEIGQLLADAVLEVYGAAN